MIIALNLGSERKTGFQAEPGDVSREKNRWRSLLKYKAIFNNLKNGLIWEEHIKDGYEKPVQTLDDLRDWVCPPFSAFW